MNYVHDVYNQEKHNKSNYNHIINFVDSNGILYDYQFGFHSNIRLVMCTSHLSNTISIIRVMTITRVMINNHYISI